MNLGDVNRFSVKQVNLSCAPQRVIHHLPIERLATFFPSTLIQPTFAPFLVFSPAATSSGSWWCQGRTCWVPSTTGILVWKTNFEIVELGHQTQYRYTHQTAGQWQHVFGSGMDRTILARVVGWCMVRPTNPGLWYHGLCWKKSKKTYAICVPCSQDTSGTWRSQYQQRKGAGSASRSNLGLKRVWLEINCFFDVKSAFEINLKTWQLVLEEKAPRIELLYSFNPKRLSFVLYFLSVSFHSRTLELGASYDSLPDVSWHVEVLKSRYLCCSLQNWNSQLVGKMNDICAAC